MVELRDEHFVAGLQGVADCGAQRVVERGHILTEGNAARTLSAEKRRERLARRGYAPVNLLRGPKVAACIDVASRVEVAEGIDHGLRNLTARRSVEIRQVQSKRRARERRKILAAAERVFRCEWHSKVCHEIFSAGGSNQGRKRCGVGHPRAGARSAIARRGRDRAQHRRSGTGDAGTRA